MTATLRAREPPNAGADSIVSAVTFSVHEGVSTSTRARPRAWFAAFVARQHVRARAHDRLRAPRAAPRRGASLRQKVRCDRAIGGPIRFSDASAFYVPEATRDASTSARSAHDVIAPAESRDARAPATRVFVAARAPPLSRSAPAARCASGRFTRRRGSTRSRCSLAPVVVPLRPGKGSFLSVFLRVGLDANGDRGPS